MRAKRALGGLLGGAEPPMRAKRARIPSLMRAKRALGGLRGGGGAPHAREARVHWGYLGGRSPPCAEVRAILRGAPHAREARVTRLTIGPNLDRTVTRVTEALDPGLDPSRRV